MYCPNCNKEYEGKFCPECGTKLIEKPAPGAVVVNLGDANAISGGIHVNDSHNIHNEDHSVHNISNVSNVTHNITNIAAQKTEMELQQERKNQFSEQVNVFLDDNELQPEEVAYLEDMRIQLGLDEMTAKRLIENARRRVGANVRQTSLGGAAASMLKFITSFFLSNDVAKIHLQLPKLAAFAKQIEVDEVQHKYHVALAAVDPQKLISINESEISDNYWRSYWSYIAYHKLGEVEKAEQALTDLYRFSQYSEENITLLQVVEIYNNFGAEEARTILDTVTGMYSQELQLFAKAVYMCVDPAMAEGLGANHENTAFYRENVITFESPEERAKREAQEKAEAEAKAKEAAQAAARSKAAAEAELRKKVTYTISITDVNSKLMAAMTLRTALGWSTAECNSKFAMLPIDVKVTEDGNAAKALAEKLSKGGLGVSVKAVNGLGEVIPDCFGLKAAELKRKEAEEKKRLEEQRLEEEKRRKEEEDRIQKQQVAERNKNDRALHSDLDKLEKKVEELKHFFDSDRSIWDRDDLISEIGSMITDILGRWQPLYNQGKASTDPFYRLKRLSEEFEKS